MAKAIWAVACLFSTLLMIAGEAPAWGAWPDIYAQDGGGAAPALTPPGPSPTPPAVAAKPVPSTIVKNNSAEPLKDLSYRMGPEDVIRVSVWENKELTLDVVVRPDGKISLPLIQDVQAEGLTANELAAVVRKRLEAFIKDAQVSIILLQVNAPKVFVIGSVAKPGFYPLRGEMTVLQALSHSGGFTQFASPRSIKLIRGSGLKQEVRKINYYNVIDEGGEGNYLLAPGDTIVVP